LFTTSMLLDSPPVKGALEGIKTLNEHEIWIVTGRPSMIKNITEKWLSVIRLNMTSFSLSVRENKLSVANGFDVFIDDFFDEVVNFGQAGIYTLLFDRPWNQSGVLPETCKRVHDWDTIISLIKKLQEQKN